MSRSKTNSKSPWKEIKFKKTKVFDEDQLDEILEKIDVKRPRSMYTHF